MTSLTATSRRSSSSSSSTSYRSSARYSTSSTFRCQGSTGGDPLDSLFEQPFLAGAEPRHLFGEEGPAGPDCASPPDCAAPFSGRTSFGHTESAGAGATAGGRTGVGPLQLLEDAYCTSADVGRFDPHDIVVMAFNNHIVIHAEKIMEDGSVSDTFTHKSLLPEDMDPLSLSGALGPDGVLVVSVRRTPPRGQPGPLAAPN